MGLTLAIDTSTRVGSVGLGEHGIVVAESLLTVKATHSEAVLPEIRRLTERTGIALRDLETVVVGAGPGSFTGVRIAASFAKGICFACRIPLFAYSSLAAIAAGVGVSTPVCATLDARRGQVYAAGYRLGAELECVFGPEAMSVDMLPARLSDGDPWVLAGSGAGSVASIARSAGWTVADEELWQPRAAALLKLASDYPEAGRVQDISAWEPGYVRLPGAERSESG